MVATLGEPLSSKWTKVLDVVGDDSPVLTTRDIEDGVVAAPHQVRSVRDGGYVDTVVPEERCDVRWQLFIQEALHPRSACSPGST